MSRAHRRRRAALAAAGALWLAAALGPAAGGAVAQQAQQPAPAEGGDPFGQSQLQQLEAAAAGGLGAVQFTVRGFVDAGYIHITQTGPKEPGGDISWAFGNSQFTFFSESSTFALNEVDLTLEGRRESGSMLYGARASVDFYPSRNSEGYALAGSEREWQVDEGFVFAEWTQAWNTRVVLGRAPGFVTLAQLEGDVPEQRLIGHTYVFQAGGGYPYGLQATTRPGGGWALKLGLANGGIGAYSFFPGEESTLNRGTARDGDGKSETDQVDSRTGYGAIDWTVFDEIAGAGVLRLGVAGASASELTFNAAEEQPEPYTFSNVYAGYRVGSFEARLEAARLEAFYEQLLGQFEARMGYLLLSWYAGDNHLLTLRGERITYTTDLAPDTEGEATKSGVSYRLRLADGVVLKAEAVREKQSPQFFLIDTGEELTTDVVTTSWVYSF